MMVVITGGIGSGKSEVAGILRDLGADVLDLDSVVHDLHARPDVRTAVAALLDLPLDYTRADVAAIVFHDAARLRELEELLHPLVWQEVADRNLASSELVLEMPLPPRVGDSDRVICVEAPLALRVERLRARGLSATDVSARLAASPEPEAYRRQATVVIRNDADRQVLRERVLEAWDTVHRAEG